MGDKIYLAVAIQKLFMKSFSDTYLYAEVLELADRQD